MGGEKQIFVDVAMVIKTMLLNPGRFILFARWISTGRLSRNSYPGDIEVMNLIRPRRKLLQKWNQVTKWPRKISDTIFDFKSTWLTTIIYRIWKSYQNKEFFEADYQALSQLYANNWSTASGCRDDRTRGKWLSHKQALVYRSQRMIKTVATIERSCLIDYS